MKVGLIKIIQGTRIIVQFLMSSVRFNTTEPLWTTHFQRKQGSTLPNLLEPLSFTGIKDHRIISHEFGVVQHYWTSSNHSAPEGTIKDHSTISHEFGVVQPSRNTQLQREQRSQYNFSWVRGGSILPNLLEPLSSRGNKDHSKISHEFSSRVNNIPNSCEIILWS